MLMELLLFAGKTLVILLFFAGLALIIAMVIAKATSHSQELEVEPLNEKLKSIGDFLRSYRLSKDELKAEAKKRKAEKKKKDKQLDQTPCKKVYVLRFNGDVKASQADSLREEVNAILQACEKNDEVLICIESPGGVVHGYGFASSQLVRLRDADLRVTVAIDQVAASGGYLMSCVAHEILAAPFAIVGSIGVVAQLPNFNKVLKKYDVEYKEYTAGEFKRTVSLFGEITPKGEEKFIEQLEETHTLFKQYVSKYRPQLNLQAVATGEYWYGEQALGLGLVDKIKTSDDFVLEKLKEDALILEVTYEKTKTFQEKIADILGKSAEKAWLRILSQAEKQKFY